MAIMSVVNAEKEGHLESKIAKARQLEEIREAKRKEAESRKSDKDLAFEERKQDLKKKRKRHSEPGAGAGKGADGGRDHGRAVGLDEKTAGLGQCLTVTKNDQGV